MSTTSLFSAEEPTLGYLYQVAYSLLLLIQSSEIPNSKIAIEQLDDIQLINPNSNQLFQLKYHLNSIANLTDRSTDLWKTLRVWCTGIDNSSIDISNTALHLITTAPAAEGTIAKELTKEPSQRNVANIITTLDEIASETTNRTNQAGYDSYNALDKQAKEALAKKIFICESSIGIEEIKQKIYSELRKTIIDNRVPALYEHLLGWYLAKTIQSLLGSITFISFLDYQQKCFEIIDTLQSDNLPADFIDHIELGATQLENYKVRTFVKQLSIIGLPSRGITSAINDYYRAFEQRAKWVRLDLVSADEELSYETRLFDDWKRKFDNLVECDPNTPDEEKATIGREFYKTHYIASQPSIHIRERFTHSYLVTGSCQMLSDKKKIGWHPEFEKNC
jgi:hypothetical protein